MSGGVSGGPVYHLDRHPEWKARFLLDLIVAYTAAHGVGPTPDQVKQAAGDPIGTGWHLWRLATDGFTETETLTVDGEDIYRERLTPAGQAWLDEEDRLLRLADMAAREQKLVIGIPVRVFVALEKTARLALRLGDLTTIEAINVRLQDANFRLIVRGGKLYVQTLDAPETRS